MNHWQLLVTIAALLAGWSVFQAFLVAEIRQDVERLKRLVNDLNRQLDEDADAEGVAAHSYEGRRG